MVGEGKPAGTDAVRRIGAGALGRSGGKVALYFREDVRLAGPPSANVKLEPPDGEAHEAIRELLTTQPCFWLDLVEALDLEPEELHAALWDLAWAGEATNDAFAPLRAPRLRSVPRAQRRGRASPPPAGEKKKYWRANGPIQANLDVLCETPQRILSTRAPCSRRTAACTIRSCAG